MSDMVGNYLRARTLSKEAILEAVDEYSLYCFYLGFDPELKTRYSSPLREGDEDPSFSIFENWYEPCEFRWKDSARGISGDIFDLIAWLYPSLDFRSKVFAKIDQDFNLGLTQGEKVHADKVKLKDRPVDKPVTNIRIIPLKEFSLEAVAFWSSFGISVNTLNLYKVYQVQYLWMNDFQEVPIAPKGLCFAYQEIDKYKIYQPYDQEFKFRNNYPHTFIEGFHQLRYESDTLIITKSRKDVMLLHELGYEAVSPKSENTVIPIEYIKYFKKRYKRVLILFDNDMKHKGDAYEFPKIYVPLETGEKDITDYRKKFGHDLTAQLMKELVNAR